jgi:hypothetical protein
MKSQANKRGASTGVNARSVRSLTRGLRTPRETFPGVARGTPPPEPHTNVCDCRCMVRPPPEPPPDQPICAHRQPRRGRHSRNIAVPHISSLGSTPMQLVCSYTGELDGVSWLLSSKQVMFRAITFIRFSDLHWTGLSRLFQWALKSCTLINCPIFQASVSGDFQKPMTGIREFPVLTDLTLGQRPRAKLLPVPDSQLLVKYKSKEHKATMKAREVLTQDKHPYRRLGKLIGGCLSLLWKEAIAVLDSKEIVAMSDILHPIRAWLSRLTEPPPGTEFRWL